MKKRGKIKGTIIVCLCIILCIWFAYAKYTEKKTDEDGDQIILMDSGEEKTKEERDQVQWEIIKDSMENNLEELEEIREIFIYPKSYVQYMGDEVIEIDVILQQGYSMSQQLEEEIESYVSVTTNCDEVIISVEKTSNQ